MVLLAQLGQERLERAPPGPSHHVADEEQLHGAAFSQHRLPLLSMQETAAIERSAIPILQAEGLVKRFGDREALRGVSLQAAAGELVAVIGPNGAGKTTLLSILAGIQPADAGRVSHGPGEIGWVPQQPALYSKLTVAENLRLFARLEGCPDVEGAVDRMLEIRRECSREATASG